MGTSAPRFAGISRSRLKFGRQLPMRARMAAPSFVLFQGRVLGTAHIVTLAPPRVDGGKYVIEARVVGGLFYSEQYEDRDEAGARYLELASILLADPSMAEGARPATSSEEFAAVTPLLRRTLLPT